jgi:3-oxoacyl-[acyl-carrier-protein] synthase II
MAAACIAGALADAEVVAGDVGHVNAHATGTTAGDVAEAKALVRVFGASPPAVTAPKGVMGHLMAAGGAAEAILTVLAVSHGVVPPTANFDKPGDGVDLDVVADRPRAPSWPRLRCVHAAGGRGHQGRRCREGR